MIPIDEQPYSLPEGWQWCRLGDVTKNQYGYTAKALKNDSLPKMLRITDIQNGAVNWREVPNCEIDDDQKKKYLLQDNDIVIARTGATTGKSFIVSKPVNSVFASYLIRLQISKTVSVRYLHYFLQSDLYWQQISELSSGIAQPGVNSSKLKKIPVPLPPLAEQQRIVSLLDELFGALDEARALAQAVVDGSKLRRAAILHKTFIGELTKLWRDEHGITLDSRQRCTLGDVCNYGRNEAVQPSAMKIGKLLIDLEDIEKDSGNLIKRKFFDGANSNSSKHSFGRGDVLYGKLRPYLNKVVIADEDGYCSSEILPLNFDERALNRFAQYILLSPDFVRYANHNSYGTNMPRLGTRAGRQAPFPLPPLDEQKEIVRVLDDMLYREQRTKDLALKTLERVELLKKSILARAFRGELNTK